MGRGKSKGRGKGRKTKKRVERKRGGRKSRSKNKPSSTKKERTSKSNRRWIQRAIKRPGELKRWLKRNAKKIEKLTGEKPFTKSGEVNTNALKKLRKTEFYEKLPTFRKQEINFAITAEKFRKG